MLNEKSKMHICMYEILLKQIKTKTLHLHIYLCEGAQRVINMGWEMFWVGIREVKLPTNFSKN